MKQKELLVNNFSLISILFFGYFFQILIPGSFIPLIPTIAKYFGCSHNVAQLILPTFYFGVMIVQFVIGYLTDNYGRKPFFVIGVLISALGSLLIALSWSISSTLVGFLIQAIGIGIIEPISSNIVTDVFDEESIPDVFLFGRLAMGIGSILAPLIATFIAFHFHWQWLFMGISITALCFAGFCKRYLYESRGSQNKATNFRVYIKRVIRLCYCFNDSKLGFFPAIIMFNGLVMGGILALYGSTSVILVHQFHRNLLHVGLLFSIASGLYLLGMIAGKFFSNKYKTRNILRFSVLLAIFSSCSIIIHNIINTYMHLNLNFLLFFFSTFFFLLSFVSGLISPSGLSLALAPFAYGEENASAAASVRMFSNNFFIVVIGLIISILHEESSLPIGITLLIIFIIAAFLLEVYCKKIKLHYNVA